MFPWQNDTMTPEPAASENVTASPDPEQLGAEAEPEVVSAADAALADMDDDNAPMGPCLCIEGKDGSVQFIAFNPETDVIAIGTQSNLQQFSLADIEQVELGVVG